MESNRLIDELISANTISGTDFRIVVGEYSWNVHSGPLKLKSGYFRAAIDGNWSESQDNVVELKEHDPLNIARMLQFIYTGDFQYQLSLDVHGNNRIVLANFMNGGMKKGPKNDFVDYPDGQQSRDIDLAMFEIAKYFDILSLREYTAKMLVRSLKTPSDATTIEQFTNDFADVFPLLQDHLNESHAMRKVETSVIALLVDWKMFMVKRGQYGGALVVNLDLVSEPKRQMRGPSSNSEKAAERLSGLIESHASNNAQFALKLSKAFEYKLDRACEKVVLPKGFRTFYNYLI